MAAMMCITFPLLDKGVLDFSNSAIFGYSMMVLAFTLVFFGVRSYRENVLGGKIGFGRAFGTGMLIVLVASVIYVITWMILYYTVIPDFVDKCAGYSLGQLKAEHAPAEKIAEATKEFADMKEFYANPVFNALMTLMEPLPVGLLASLITAFAVKKK